MPLSASRPPINAAPRPIPGVVSATPDQQYLQTIGEHLETSAHQDFSLFLEMFEVLRDTISDEATCFAAAFRSAEKVHGITRQGVLDSINDRLRLLAESKQEFLDSLERRRRQELGSNQSETEKDEQAIAQKEQEIAELRNRIAMRTAETSAVAQHLDSALASYDTAHVHVDAELRRTLEGVTRHIPA
jgi:hypothetical protein